LFEQLAAEILVVYQLQIKGECTFRRKESLSFNECWQLRRFLSDPFLLRLNSRVIIIFLNKSDFNLGLIIL